LSRIDVIEDTDYKGQHRDMDTPMPWREYLEVNGYNKEKEESLEDMCKNCISGQMEKYGKITIRCTGLTTYKNKVSSTYGEDIYKIMVENMKPEDMDIAEQTENSYHWMDKNVDTETLPEKRVFKPRWHQKRINACSAKGKVLRMGRRCVDSEEQLKGKKKDYSVKHLYQLFKHRKKLPYIMAYDIDESKLVYTDKYVILRNDDTIVVEILLSNGKKTSVTREHPLFVFKDKQYKFVAAEDLEIGDYMYLADNTTVTVVDINYISNRKTYHISVLKYETFVTKSLIINHNTGKTFTMTIGLLHKMLVNQDYKVLMIAPMATMIDEVVAQIKTFCDKMEVNPIVKSTQSPIAYIEFSTGSTFKGVTAGASGSKGARGKAANLLYIDECLPPNSRIRLPDGTTRAVEDLEVGDYVLSYNLEQKKFVAQKVITIKCTGRKEVYKYYTVTGKKFESTGNHPVLTSEGWRPAKEAKDLAVTNTKTSNIFFESIVRTQFKGVDRVYNIEVENTHNYIANDCIVHNCDFLRPSDLDSILGILADNKDTELWASSTPIGETNLYKLSKNPKFKEFHYPTYVVDHYDNDLDETFRDQLSDIGYKQEVLGLFGTDSDAVFQLKFIESSILDAEFEVTKDHVLQNRKDYIVVIGVDWNHDKIGTRVVVLAYNKISGKFLVAHKDTVSLEGWTQPLAIQKIIDLNREFRADEIYADEGFGISQVTMLRKYGLDQAGKVPPLHPDLRLIDTVAVNFSRSIQYVDPMTGEMQNKQTKQYIVENMANILSRGLLILQEEKDSAIILQFKNYILKSKSANGRKVYGYRDKQIGDHDLDALMIALHGFLEKYGEMTNFNASIGVAQMVSRTDMGYHSNVNLDQLEPYIQSTDIMMNKRSSVKINSRSNFKKRKRW
jgi:hypothetical protein